MAGYEEQEQTIPLKPGDCTERIIPRKDVTRSKDQDLRGQAIASSSPQDMDVTRYEQQDLRTQVIASSGSSRNKT